MKPPRFWIHTLAVRLCIFPLRFQDSFVRFSVSIGAFQQTTSGLSTTNQDCYELEQGCFSVYGFEYKPGWNKFRLPAPGAKTLVFFVSQLRQRLYYLDQQWSCSLDDNGLWNGSRHANRDIGATHTSRANGTLSTHTHCIFAKTLSMSLFTQYIIANLGFSTNFGDIAFDRLTFPTTMSVDYIRVYQPKGARNIGGDHPEFPTAAYIQA